MNARIGIVVILASIAGTLWWEGRRGETADNTPLPQEAYVWQRAWTSAVVEAIHTQGPDFSALPVLAAEVRWPDGRPDLTRLPPDFDVLKSAGTTAYPVVRVAVYQGSFETNAPAARYLCRLGQRVVEEWTTNNSRPAELQLDFDCPTGRLAEYRKWVEALRTAIAPVRLTITALPTWLGSRDFPPLAGATDGFVLQVHSFRPPRDASEPYVLCDPTQVRGYVETAAGIGIPFRVALPSYGYRMLFDQKGRLKGLAAEGSVKDWPEDTVARELRADPVAMAGLVRDWMNERPRTMKGIIWYRLPNRDDELNWSWPTLSAVMTGHAPAASLKINADARPDGLVELTALNRGNAVASLPVTIRLQWRDARMIAGDGLAGLEMFGPANDRAQLRRTAAARPLQPGEHAAIGWMRLNRPAEVRIEY